MTELAPSPFFAGTTLQFAWDNTSLSALMKCPYYYKLTIIDGWRKREESIHLTFGKHFADAMERYHKLRAEGRNHEDAVDEVVSRALIDSYGMNSDDPNKNRETLIRTIVWYFEEYKEDSCTTVILDNGAPAVELSYKFESGIPDPSGGEYLLTGHLDRMVEFGGDKFVMDQKTTKLALGSYYFAQYDLDTQMSGYTFAGRTLFNIPVSGVIIDAAQIMVGFTAFARGITMRSVGQLEEWHENTANWLGLAERFADTQVYPQNRQSCGNYGGCAFKNVCNKDPAVRQHFLETDFEKRFWNPLEVR